MSARESSTVTSKRRNGRKRVKGRSERGDGGDEENMGNGLLSLEGRTMACAGQSQACSRAVCDWKQEHALTAGEVQDNEAIPWTTSDTVADPEGANSEQISGSMGVTTGAGEVWEAGRKREGGRGSEKPKKADTRKDLQSRRRGEAGRMLED